MESKTTDVSKAAAARAWLDMARSKWRLQTMQHRSRYNPRTGEYKQLPTRIRRFLNGTPVGMKSEVLAILRESAPYRSPVFDCEIDEGLSYVPTNTFIRKDGAEHATGGKDPTYTIIQDLLLDDGLGDAYSFGDESSCSQLGEAEYHWDEPSVTDCPDGSQGVSYQITDISRDRETDLFSYRVRRVQALTAHMQPQVIECDRRKRVTVETWDNVYGEPGAFRQDPARGGSAPIAVPDPCSQPDGTAVKVDVYRNPDCTYRLTVQTVEAKVDDPAQFSVYKDQYKQNDSVRTANAAQPLPRLGTDYSGGVMTRHTSERNEDGTWNNTTEKETEREVLSSTVERRITPRGTVKIVTNTNQTSAAGGISTAFGSWKYTKTPGGRYTNEYVEYTRDQLGRLGVTCSDTAFMKTHEDQGGAAGLPAATSHVAAASGGLVTTWTYDTDSEGFVTRRVRTEQEHTVLNATRRTSAGLLGTTVGYQHRSVSKAVAEGLLAGAGAGTTVEMRLTNGNLWDVDVQSFTRLAGANLGLSCEKTVFQHAHEASSGASSIPANVHADDAGGGHTYRRTYSVDPSTGAITVRSQDTEEIYVRQSRRTTRVTARGTETRTTSSNAANPPGDATAAGTTVEWELTPGGRYNVTTTTTTPKQGSTGATCENDALVHTDSSTGTSVAAPTGHVSGGTGGKYSERTSRLGDDGLWETTTVEHQEKTPTLGEETTVTARGMRKTTKKRQQNGTGSLSAEDAGKAFRSTLTRGGYFDVEETTTTARTGDSGKSKSADAFLTSDGTTKMARDGNLTLGGTGSGGKYSEGTSRLGDDGLWETTTVEHQEKTPTLGEETTVTARGMRKTTKKRQQNGTGSLSAEDAGKAFRSTLTRGGYFDVEETTTTARTGDSGKSKSADAFLTSDGTTKMARDGNLTLGGTGSGGKYSEGTSRLGDDGLWETTTVEHQEKTPTLGEETTVTARGMRKTTKKRQQNGTGSLSAEDAGKAFRSTLTRGGYFDVEETTTTARTGDSGKSKSADAFLTSDGTTKMARDGNLTLGGTGSGGKYSEGTSRLGDDGLWETTTVEHQEKTPTLGEETTVTARGMRKTTKKRQQNGTGSLSAEDAGKAFRSTLTRGGYFDVEETTTTARTGDSGKSKSADAFLTSDGTTKMARDGNLTLGGTGSGGKYSEGTSRLGDDGLWETTTVEHQEKTPTLGEETTVTARGMRKTTKKRQQNGTGSLSAEDAGKAFRSTLTRGGYFDVEETTTTARTGDSGKSKSADAFLTSDGTTKMARDGNLTLGGTGSGGKYSEGTSRLGDDGLWETTTVEHQEKTPTLGEETTVTARGMRKTTKKRQQNGTGSLSAEDAGKAFRSTLTRGGYFDVEETTTTARTGDSGKSKSADAFLTSDGTTKMARDGNLTLGGTGSGGKYSEGTSRLGDDGLWETTTVEHQEKTPTLGEETTVTARGMRKTTKKRQQNGTGSLSAEDAGKAFRSTLTRGGYFDVEETTTTARTGDSGKSKSADAFLTSDGTTKMARDGNLTLGGTGSGGKYAEGTSRLGDDGLWETTTVEHQEKTAPLGEETTVTARGMRKTTKSRKATGTSSLSAEDAGKAFRSTLTRGGYFDVEETTTTARTSDSGKSKSADAFLTSNGKTKLSRNGSLDLTGQGTGGKYSEGTSRLGDDGLWETTTVEHQEKTAPLGEETTVTARGMRKTTKSRKATGTSSLSAEDAGKAFRSTLTRGGYFDVEETTTTARTGDSGKSKSADAFLTSDGTTKLSRNGSLDLTGQGTGGKYSEGTSRLGDDGLWETTTVDHQEKTAPLGEETTVTARGMRKTTKSRKATGTSSLSAEDAGKAFRSTLTRGGYFDVEETTTTARTSDSGKSKSADAFLTSNGKTKLSRNGSLDLTGRGTGGKYSEGTSRLGDDGLWETTTVEHQEKTPTLGEETTVTARGMRKTTKKRQQNGTGSLSAEDAGKAFRSTLTRGGYFDVEETTTTARTGDSGKSKSADAFLTSDGTTKLSRNGSLDLTGQGTGGKYSEGTSRLGDDGLWETTTVDHQEKTAPLGEETTVTARGMRKTTKSRKATGTSSLSAEDAGKAFRSTLTRGGYFDVEETTTTARTSDSGKSKSADAFLTSNGKTKLSRNGSLDLTGQGTGGKYSEGTSRLGDDGLWETTTVEHQEKTAPLGEETTVTARGMRKTTKSRKATGTSSLSAEDAGKAFRSTLTRGGYFDVEETTTTARTGDSGKSKSADAFLTSDGTTKLSRNGSLDLTGQGTGGKYSEGTSRLGDDGLWETTTVDHQEKTAPLGEETTVTARGMRKTTKSRKATGTSSLSAEDAGKAFRSTLTRGGYFDVEETTTTARTSDSGKSKSADAFLTSNGKTKLSRNGSLDLTGQGTGGKYSEGTSRLGDDGLWETTTVEHQEKTAPLGEETTVTARGMRKTTKSRKATGTSSLSAEDAGKAFRSTLTRGGYFDVEETTTTARTSDSGKSKSADAFLTSNGKTKLSRNGSLDLTGQGTGGKYSEGTSRLGDDGLWETTTVDHQEKTAPLGEETTVTARGMRKTTKSRKATGTSSLSAEDAGKAFRSTLTRGGYFDVEETTTTARTGDSGKSKSADAFLTSDGTTKLSRNGSLDLTGQGTGGKYSEGTSRLGDDGLWETTTVDHQEKTAPLGEETTVTARGMRKTTKSRKATGTSSLSAEDAGKAFRSTLTRGGYFDVEETTTTARTSDSGKSKSADAFLTSNGKTKLSRNGSLDLTGQGTGGKYSEGTSRLGDDGLWETTTVDHQEKAPNLTARKYQDAFGTTDVHEDFSTGSADGTMGGRRFSRENEIQSVESVLTKGGRYNVRTTTETPGEVDSGWLHVERQTSKGLGVFDDFVVFRNAKLDKVQGWLDEVRDKGSREGNGSWAVHPRANVAPNRFGLWDGTIGVTTTFTPKAWSSGGSTPDDNWEQTVTVKSVSFVPLSATKLLRVVTTETHKKGGGVGKDKMKALVAGGIIKGSQFSYHPGGQAFSYDIITKTSCQGTVVDMPRGNAEATLWNY